MTNPLKNCLKQLELLDAVFYKENGEVYNGFTSEVQKKINIIKPDAYYVFNKQPLILFFDLTKEKNTYRESEIHKQVWSFDNSPVIFVIKEDGIKVYNALNYDKEEQSLEEIELDDEKRNDKFSFWNLQSGFVWTWLQKEYFEIRSKKHQRKRVNEKLFENIKEVREHLTTLLLNPLSENQANSLILRLIFIRYLIDRKVKIDENLIVGDLENVNARRKSFIQLIKQPKELNSLFVKLNNKFNGVLFKELDFILDQNQSDYLAGVFKGELQDEENLFNDFFFEIFDFSIIPVEVISGIYESLIDEETRKLDAAVYTPPFLVEYVLNDTIDKFLEEKNSSECKIFEVAVGSGIFLVQSLRKMIDKELEINSNQDKKEFSKRIREIAKNNLFGIDINGEALKVACFSIYIALLDYQDPKDIDSYEFPNLIDSNLFKADFFDIEHDFNKIIKKEEPKFILGNPPWKKDKSKNHLNWVNSTTTYSKKVKGKFEIAQSFLLRTKDFMSEETKSALIVTSTLFYNISSTTKEFKNDFLTSFCIEKFFDLSPVRRLIFEKKNSPASIVYFSLAKDKNYLNNVVNHQSVKSNHFLKHFKILVIEKYDRKKILQKYFIENDWMFKVALYGNTLDFALINKIFKSSDTKVKDLIDNKTLHSSSGILKGTPKNHFDFLIGLPLNENSSIKNYYTNNSKNHLTKDEVYLEAGRSIEKFNSDKILFKEQAENESEIVISFNEKPSVFKKGIYGLSSDSSNLLFKLYSTFISNLYEYFIFMISGSWGTSTRPQIRWKEEYLLFPILDYDSEVSNKLIQLAKEFLKPYQDFYSKFNFGVPEKNNFALWKINEVVNKSYNLKNYEVDLINYVLSVSRYQFQESKQNLVSNFTYTDNSHYRNRDFVLKNYAEVYLNEFQKIYANEYIQVEIYPLDHFIALNFVFSTQKPKESILYPKDKKSEGEVLKCLANNLSVSQITNTTDPTQNLFIQKDIKGFEKNSFYIIKPNEYKCWHRAMAWYDVAEFKEAIETAELKSLSANEF